MSNVIKLCTDGVAKVDSGTRSFTRVIGGFGDNKPILTIKQIADLMEYDVKVVNQTINRNIESFVKEDGYILDIKEVTDSDYNLEVLKSLGYSNMAISKAKNLYILSEAGFLLYLKFAEGDKSVEIYKDFIEDYFKIKHENQQLKSTLLEELKELKNERKKILGIATFGETEEERIEAQKQAEKLNDRIIKLSSTIENKNIQTALDSQIKLTESKYEYLNQSEFGARFNCKIGSKMLGKLLKIVGLAKKSIQKRTVPYQEYVPKFAYNDIQREDKDENEVHYNWNYNKCIEKIDDWLKTNDVYDKFYSITDNDILKCYINGLYNKHVLNIEE